MIVLLDRSRLSTLDLILMNLYTNVNSASQSYKATATMADMMYFMKQNKKKEEVKKKERAEKEKLKVSSELSNVLNIFYADCRHPIRNQK
jgi:hypothetical protein